MKSDFSLENIIVLIVTGDEILVSHMGIEGS